MGLDSIIYNQQERRKVFKWLNENITTLRKRRWMRIEIRSKVKIPFLNTEIYLCDLNDEDFFDNFFFLILMINGQFEIRFIKLWPPLIISNLLFKWFQLICSFFLHLRNSSFVILTFSPSDSARFPIMIVLFITKYSAEKKF